MEGEQVRRWEAQCIQEQAPACSATCPLHVDVRKLLELVQKDKFTEAFKLYAAFVPLPRILASVCDHPCEGHCRRAEAGDPLRISLIEKACLEFAASPQMPRKQLQRRQTIAVVGGGLSGVTAAIEMATKGYAVTLYEAAEELLPRLRHAGYAGLTEEIIAADLAALDALVVSVQLGSLVTFQESPLSLGALKETYDAVYLGCGAPFDGGCSNILDKDSNGRIVVDPLTGSTSQANIFAGGTLRYAPAAYSPVTSIYDGRCASVSMDRYLQGASLTANREGQGPQPTRLYTDTSIYAPLPLVPPTGPGGRYTRDEARAEAARCFPCSCLECVKVCEYLKHYGAYPKRYVREIYNNLSIVMGVRNQNRMINSCSLCGLCETVCPEKLSMAEICQVARDSMVAAKKMPVSTHEFALRDLEFSTSDAFALARHQPGMDHSSVLFFPGCQFAASSPEHVESCYKFLCSIHPGGVGLVLNCCGAPARWSGRQELFAKSMETMRRIWREMGEPRIITACSSCYHTFRTAAPDLPVESLWPHLNQDSLPSSGEVANTHGYAIHDPCATRGVAEVEGSARQVLHRLGVQPQELNRPGETTCCGYGGLASFANPSLIADTVQRRAAVSDAEYITYCAMCRDSFARQGKRAVHLLDLVFGNIADDPAARPDPGYSRRRENRAHLKSRLLRELWGADATEEVPTMNLRISPEIQAIMERRMILEEDVRATIEHAESTGSKIQLPEHGHWLATYCPACVTYWVEYVHEEGGYTVVNTYSHRMQVH